MNESTIILNDILLSSLNLGSIDVFNCYAANTSLIISSYICFYTGAVLGGKNHKIFEQKFMLTKGPRRQGTTQQMSTNIACYRNIFHSKLSHPTRCLKLAVSNIGPFMLYFQHSTNELQQLRILINGTDQSCMAHAVSGCCRHLLTELSNAVVCLGQLCFCWPERCNQLLSVTLHCLQVSSGLW